MIVHLLNAAVMPHAGFYELKQIDVSTFVELVREASEAGNLRHYIGYKETLEIIQTICRLNLGDINVAQTELKNGDRFLVVRLRRRLTPEEKVRTVKQGATLTVEDFDFFSGVYQLTACAS